MRSENQQIKPKEFARAGKLVKGYRYHYTSMNQLQQVVAPDGTSLIQRSYTPYGELEKEKDATGSWIAYQYDYAGHRTQVETAGGRKEQYHYDALGGMTAVQDAERTTQYELDDWGRIQKVITPEGILEQYRYDFAGNIIEAIDGEGKKLQYCYNESNLLDTIFFQDGQKESYEYDLEGYLSQKTTRANEIIQYEYNFYGNLRSKRERNTGLAQVYGYNQTGELAYALANGMRYEYRYGEFGRLQEKKASGKTLLAYEYDFNGNKVKQRDLTGKETTYEYDALDRLHKVYDNGRQQAEYQYYTDGAVKQLLVGENLCTKYGYDIDKNLTSLTSNLGEECLVKNQYQYDAYGNCVQKEMLSGLTKYQYDKNDRLVQVQYPTYEEKFYYDRSNNRVRRSVAGLCVDGLEKVASFEEYYKYNDNNQLIARTVERRGFQEKGLQNQEEILEEDTITYRYDACGNMIQEGKNTFEYNSFGQMTQAKMANGKVQVNHYDAEELRYEVEENGKLVQFLFNEEKKVVVEKSENEVLRYIRGHQIVTSDSEQAKVYYHYASDERGSVTHVVENENVVNWYEYDAFGNTIAKEEQIENRFGYTGEQYDAVTGQYYLRARYYNAVIGRFTQEDTYHGDGLNLYAYCAGNPVHYVDPSGRTKCPGGDIDNEARYIRSVGERKQNIVYRTIRPDEVIEDGLVAKNPKANCTLTGHVNSNSKKGYGSQFISTTTDFDGVAKQYADRFGYRVVEIDLNKIPKEAEVYDLSLDVNRRKYLKGFQANNFAKASKEVDIKGYIPKEAITLKYTPTNLK